MSQKDEDAQVVEWLREALDMDAAWADIARGIVSLRRSLAAPKPDHRQCQRPGCGHSGSVHDGEEKTDLGWSVEGKEACRGLAEVGPCKCTAFVPEVSAP